MIIVNKKEFYQLAEGTLYTDYEPCIFTNLKIKGSTIYNNNFNPYDFYYTNLIGNIKYISTDDLDYMLDDSEANKTSLDMDFQSFERDGLFKANQLFAVYEKKDIEQLIKKLNTLISV